MLIEKMIFNILAFSLFIIIFAKLIKKNDSNYVFIIILQAIGIALNFAEIMIKDFSGSIIKVIMYVFAIIIPLGIIMLEMAQHNVSEFTSIMLAKFLMGIGNNKAAKSILLNLVDKYDSYKGHLLLAKIYEKDGGMRRAIDEYVMAVDINKQDYDSYYRIAELLNELDKPDEAITMLQNLLRNKGDYYDASILLGELLGKQERFKEAVNVYTEALQYRPLDYELYYCLGIAYTRLNDFANAKLSYEKAAEINHVLYTAKYNLGQIALIEKDMDAAEMYFKECLMSEELEAKAYYQLSKIYLIRGEKDKAINFANKAIELDEVYLEIIGKNPIFESIRTYLTVSVKLGKQKETKKISKEDELVQKHLEETYTLINNLNENDIKNRANQKVDDIFKMEEERKQKELEERDVENNQF